MIPAPATHRLHGIEAMRGVAACAVVLYHVARHVNQAEPMPALVRATQWGHAGVDLFFVLSGFIILHVHARDLGRPARLGHYLRRRAVRVLPIYWIALGCTLLMAAFGSHAAPTAARIFSSALLLPASQEPVLGIAWTLQYEMVFYAVFCVLILNRRLGAALLALILAWLLTALFVPRVVPAGMPPMFCGAYSLDFYAGLCVAWWLAHADVPQPRAVAAAGLALLASVGMAESLGKLNGYGTSARLCYGLACAVLILGIVAWERTGGLRVPGWMRRLGAASYSIYLFQFLCIGAAWLVWQRARLPSGLTAWLALSAAAIGGGMLVSMRLEQPLMRRLRP